MVLESMKKRKYKSKDVSPVGWYIASYLQRFVFIGEDNENPAKRYSAWENTIIVRANDPDEAYKKAVKQAKLGCKPYTNTDGQRVQFVYEGLTSLLPIYEDLADGCEIMWAEHNNRTLKKLRSWVKDKDDLEVFEDYNHNHGMQQDAATRRR